VYAFSATQDFAQVLEFACFQVRYSNSKFLLVPEPMKKTRARALSFGNQSWVLFVAFGMMFPLSSIL